MALHLALLAIIHHVIVMGNCPDHSVNLKANILIIPQPAVGDVS
jgi:hypothetical protein